MSGKYLEVWHRTAEGWRLHRDISNSDAPPEAPPPAPEEAPPEEAPPEAQQPQ